MYLAVIFYAELAITFLKPINIFLFFLDGTSSAEQSVSTLAVSDHARYFQWVNKVKDIFLFWKKKFSSHNIMHQEIEMYHEHREEIYKLAEVFQDRSLAVSDSDVASLKMLFLQQFEKLNMILIKYIPGSTDGKWYVYLQEQFIMYI